MSLATQIKSGLKSAVNAVADLLVIATLNKVSTNPYVPGTDVSDTVTSYSMRAFFDKFTYMEQRSDMYTDKDAKLIFPDISTVIPVVGDTVTVDGLSYRITKTTPVYLANEVVAVETIVRIA